MADLNDKNVPPTNESEEAKAAPKEDGIAAFAPGTLIGVDWSRQPELELRDSHIKALRELLRDICNRDMPARREEIIRVWEADLFWRGYQHLLPRRNGGWQFADQGTGFARGEQSARSMFETNFYLSFGESVVAALTRDIPKVRMVPSCPTADQDITAAAAANKLINVIKRQLNFLGLMAEEVRYLYTDGRCLTYTRYVKDGQRFGYEPEPEGLTPEEETAAGVEGTPQEEASEPAAEAQAEAGVPKTARSPRGFVDCTPCGALETKIAMKANSLSETSYILRSYELDLAVAKGKWPKKAENIKVSRGGPGGDDIDRLARVNVRLGVEDNFITTDSEAWDVTVQEAWLRPAALLDMKDKESRDDLLAMAPGGLRVTFAGEEFIEAKEESIEDHWSLKFALPGDGAHRPGLGTSYIPAQKVVNNLLELANDYLVNGIPIKWMDNDTFDVEHIKDQNNVPGGIRPFQAVPGTPVEQLVFVEPVINFPQELLALIQDLGKGEIAQLLTGVYPALAGGDTGSNDTGVGMKMQRDNALGRIGLPWRNIKEGVAQTMLQAVQCLAKNHTGNIHVSGLKKDSDPILVELEDLKGKFLCYPETDENFPESWTEKQNRLQVLMLGASEDPTGKIAEIVYAPQNFELFKNGMGVPELYVPKAASYEKQLGEIEVLKKSAPEPNPAFIEAQQQFAELEATAGQDPDLAEHLPEIKQQIAQIPPEISSVPVDDIVDDHDLESLTCQGWLRSPEARAMKNGTPEEQAGYQNVRLHYQEHQEALAQQQAGQNKEPQKGVSKSVSYKDLAASDPAAAEQLLAEGNIQATPGAAAEAGAKAEAHKDISDAAGFKEKQAKEPVPGQPEKGSKPPK